MKVPFLDLHAQYQTIREEIAFAMQKVLDDTAFAGGPYVAQFEKEFAAFCGCQHAIGVSNGTAALWMALRGLGVGPGDEVITVPNTFIATAEAISLCGAKPMFVDVDENTYTMNPAILEAAITSRTAAIIPVHLYGQMADMDAIMAIARAHKLLVIEDACQAHGATYKGRPAGSIGDAGCFSFYPGKNLGAYGEAGAVVTNNTELAEKIKLLRDHGQPKKYSHTVIGWNDRMDGLQGAILSVKLKHLPAWNEARRAHAQFYRALLAGLENAILPREAYYARHVYHIYAIRVQNRDRVMKALAEKGIQCGVHYPITVHLQEAYHFLGLRPGSFPIAEKCAAELLSLPMFPELTKQQIEHVAGEVKRLVGWVQWFALALL
jgi:dTDP-4-amino-4,6-dideoxygalactose transaminase